MAKRARVVEGVDRNGRGQNTRRPCGQAGRVRGGQAAPAVRLAAGEEVFEQVPADSVVVREQQLLRLLISVACVCGGEVGVLEQAAGRVKRGLPPAWRRLSRRIASITIR